MNMNRPADPNHRKSVLKPLSTGKKKRSEADSPGDSRNFAAPPASSVRVDEPRAQSHSDHDSQATHSDRSAYPGSVDKLRDAIKRQYDGFTSRRVAVPVWLVVLLAIALVAGPILAVVSLPDSGDGGDRQADVIANPEATSVQDEDDEIPLALEVDEMFDSRQWDEPALPAVSHRQQYLLDQGVNPNQEVRYAADEVERLQAELEAIQRNSAMLRSLARQQSGDLSEAYSSLEATQEQSDGALEDLQVRIDELEGRIQSVDDLARELRDLLGMPPPESGMGGPQQSGVDEENADPWLTLRSDIVAVEQWAGALVFDLDEVNTEVQLRLAQINQAGIPRGTSLSADIDFHDSMPMGWPVDGPITSRFGVRSSPFAGEGGASEMHTGIDIAARSGTPVVATGGGTIQLAGNNGGYGLLVIVDHGRGVTSWYGHNSQLLVSPGQRVNAGDVIAEVGSTGRSTGAHVHYEVRVYGAPEDPMPYMQMQR